MISRTICSQIKIRYIAVDAIYINGLQWMKAIDDTGSDLYSEIIDSNDNIDYIKTLINTDDILSVKDDMYIVKKKIFRYNTLNGSTDKFTSLDEIIFFISRY